LHDRLVPSEGAQLRRKEFWDFRFIAAGAADNLFGDCEFSKRVSVKMTAALR
jgi:hypothetical protein